MGRSQAATSEYGDLSLRAVDPKADLDTMGAIGIDSAVVCPMSMPDTHSVSDPKYGGHGSPRSRPTRPSPNMRFGADAECVDYPHQPPPPDADTAVGNAVGGLRNDGHRQRGEISYPAGTLNACSSLRRPCRHPLLLNRKEGTRPCRSR